MKIVKTFSNKFAYPVSYIELSTKEIPIYVYNELDLIQLRPVKIKLEVMIGTSNIQDKLYQKLLNGNYYLGSGSHNIARNTVLIINDFNVTEDTLSKLEEITGSDIVEAENWDRIMDYFLRRIVEGLAPRSNVEYFPNPLDNQTPGDTNIYEFRLIIE